MERINQNQKMSTCNQLDLDTLGSWLIVPKNYGHALMEKHDKCWPQPQHPCPINPPTLRA